MTIAKLLAVAQVRVDKLTARALGFRSLDVATLPPAGVNSYAP